MRKLRSQCDCHCHDEGMNVKHMVACCFPDYGQKIPTCPECGSECIYTYDGSHDPRWVCSNDGDCDFWGLV